MGPERGHLRPVVPLPPEGDEVEKRAVEAAAKITIPSFIEPAQPSFAPRAGENVPYDDEHPFKGDPRRVPGYPDNPTNGIAEAYEKRREQFEDDK